MKERNKAIPASYLILKRRGEILLARRQGSGYYDGWYALPAGHVEAGELPLDCLVREIKEELGIEIEKKDAILAHTMYRTKLDETGDRADYFFIVEKWRGEPTIMEKDKSDNLQWFSLNAVPANTVPYVLEALRCVERGVSYSEFDFDQLQKFTPNKGPIPKS